jgi:hypothetical protein
MRFQQLSKTALGFTNARPGATKPFILSMEGIPMTRSSTLGVVLVVCLLSIASTAAVFLLFGVNNGQTVNTTCTGSQCTPQASTTTLTTTETVTTSLAPSTVLTTVTQTTLTTTTTSVTTTNIRTGGPSQRLGFWLQESNIMGSYTPSSFFNAMFLTPPYPSTMEVMVFAIQQDETNNHGCTLTSPYVNASLRYWGQVAQIADSYPNIRLVFEIAFDPSSGGSGVYGLGCFNSVVQALGQYSSVYGMGVEGEYTQASRGMTESEMQTAMNDVTATGKLFINYYPPVPIPPGGYEITHTNFPGGDAGGYDQVGTLQNYVSQSVGLDSGYYADFQFPGTVTCPIARSAMNSSTAGWNQCVVSTELSAAVNFSPLSARQFLEIDAGFSSSGSFTGVSGQTTNQLWDNPTLRNWIWTDPDYLGNFILAP